MSDLYDKLYEDIAACARAAIPVDPDDGTTFIKIDGVTPIWGSPDIVAAAVASAMYTVVGIRLDDARAEGVAAGRKQAAADLRPLIDDLTDPDPCWYDHHGYCQGHGWMETDPRCPHARAKDVLAEGGGQ